MQRVDQVPLVGRHEKAGSRLDIVHGSHLCCWTPWYSIAARV
jgi:hypothetical protein